MRAVIKTAGAGRNDDRASHHSGTSGDLFVLADGAGGMGGGAWAAEQVIERARCVSSATEACALLCDIDSALATGRNAGESTAVLVQVRDGAVLGASVGDSGAWLLTAQGIEVLTEHQAPKPRLGSGAAEPVSFGPRPLAGRLLIASDGLFKYVPRARILAMALIPDLTAAAEALIAAARLPSGELQDDVTVVLADGC